MAAGSDRLDTRASAEQTTDTIKIILKFTKIVHLVGMAVSSLEVSTATGASGPVLVLAGEADFTSITRLDEALTAQISGQAVQLTIDAANLRYADSASMRTLVMAAMKARTRAGSVTLLDPQPAVARMRICCASTRCSRSGAGQRVILTRTWLTAGQGGRPPRSFGSFRLFFPPNGPGFTPPPGHGHHAGLPARTKLPALFTGNPDDPAPRNPRY